MCGTKKETPGLKLDTSRQTLHDMRSRPKVTTAHSESNLTVFANGHHRPCHRNNNSAHISGLPYQLSRPHSHHDAPAFTAISQGDNYNSNELSRDTHSLVNNDFHTVFGSSLRSTDILPPTPLTGNFDLTGLPNFPDSFQDPLFTGQSSTFGQGNSPTESHLSETLAGPWPWTVNPNPNFGYESLTTSPSQSQEYLPALDNEWAIPSAGLANPSWSAGDLPLNPNKLSDNFVEPISHSGESKQSAPGLTTSSSPSEMGEPTLFADLDFRAPPSTASESLFWEDSPVYRVAPSTVHESRAPTSVPQRSTPEPQGLDLQFSKTLGPVATTTTSSASSLYGEAQAIAMPTSMDEAPPSAPWMMSQPPTVYPSSIYATFGLPNTFNSWR
jgi:hypothetical protein